MGLWISDIPMPEIHYCMSSDHPPAYDTHTHTHTETAITKSHVYSTDRKPLQNGLAREKVKQANERVEFNVPLDAIIHFRTSLSLQ